MMNQTNIKLLTKKKRHYLKFQLCIILCQFKIAILILFIWLVNQTIMETDKIVPTVTNLADRQRFIEAKRNLVNAAARFVTVGESRNHKAIVERIF